MIIGREWLSYEEREGGTERAKKIKV